MPGWEDAQGIPHPLRGGEWGEGKDRRTGNGEGAVSGI